MNFANLTEDQLTRLAQVKVDVAIVSKEAAKQITDILELEGKTEDELTAIRNAVVRDINKKYIDPAYNSGNRTDFAKYNRTVSGAVTIIDKTIFEIIYETTL